MSPSDQAPHFHSDRPMVGMIGTLERFRILNQTLPVFRLVANPNLAGRILALILKLHYITQRERKKKKKKRHDN